MSDAYTFNLIDMPWIRVRLLSGETEEKSLLGTFRDADNIAALANDLPTQDFAILRVLLAILQRSVVLTLEGNEDPAEVWSELWRADGLPLTSIEKYLETWRHRFDLFDKEVPFMQVADMHTSKNDIFPVSKIVADVPDGTAFFTMRNANGSNCLTFAEAARWLVHAHAFDTAGIKSGVIGDPNVKGGKSYSTGYPGWAGCIGGIYFEDKTLARTLLSNLVLWDSWANQSELVAFDDVPVWEQSPKTPAGDARTPRGFADMYTWQSRRVILHPSQEGVIGVVLTNGDKLEPHNKQGLEPMTSWKRSENQEKKLGIFPVHLPSTHRMDRSFWRSLTSMLPAVDEGGDVLPPGTVDWISYLQGRRVYPRDLLVRSHAVGMIYGTQNSVVTDMVDDTLMLNAFLLGPDGRNANVLVRDVLKRADEAVFAFGTFSKNLRIAEGGDDRSNDVRDRAQAMAYFELDAIFRAWLGGLSPDSNLRDAQVTWNIMARKALTSLANSLIRQISPVAISGHGNRTGWMTAAKAESIFRHKLNELLPYETDIEEGA